MTVVLVLEDLNNVVRLQNSAPGLNVHTDLGSQYTSLDAQEQLKKH